MPPHADRANDEPCPTRPAGDDGLPFVRRPMVRWLDPHQLLDTATRVLASGSTLSLRRYAGAAGPHARLCARPLRGPRSSGSTTPPTGATGGAPPTRSPACWPNPSWSWAPGTGSIAPGGAASCARAATGSVRCRPDANTRTGSSARTARPCPARRPRERASWWPSPAATTGTTASSTSPACSAAGGESGVGRPDRRGAASRPSSRTDGGSGESTCSSVTTSTRPRWPTSAPPPPTCTGVNG